jgi:uncharacterized Zn finger protein (UPF0148 family)
MSDFDKEAERERLREKYEQDQKKREASERMSDLLLKGATMTNAHCNNCGDPIFRYDGDEFCPTCQQVVTEDEAAETAAGQEAPDAPAGEQTHSADETATNQIGTETATHEADAANGTAPAGDSPDHIEIKQPDGPTARTGADQSVDPSQSAQGQSGASEGAPQPSATGQQSRTQQSPTQQPPATASSTPSADAGDDFEAARASLVRTLRSHAEQADQCDDPRRARDHLAAAREAAEALSALSGSY